MSEPVNAPSLNSQRFKAKVIFQLLRIDQYTKNVLVFAPVFFVGQISDLSPLIASIWAFIAFSLLASAVYIANDALDIEHDQLHPIKRNRPLAAKKITTRSAMMIMAGCGTVSLLIASQVSAAVLAVMLIYLSQNLLYSFWLKHQALIDVAVIASGFVLRLFVGAFAAGVALSAWIIIMTFLLALFIALAKRRDDCIMYEATGVKPRSNIAGYNRAFLDVAIGVMASVIIVAYVNYTIAVAAAQLERSVPLYATSVFVILGLLRYLQLTLVFEKSGSPTRIFLSDRFTQAVVGVWLMTFAFAIYWL